MYICLCSLLELTKLTLSNGILTPLRLDKSFGIVPPNLRELTLVGMKEFDVAWLVGTLYTAQNLSSLVIVDNQTTARNCSTASPLSSLKTLK